MDNKIPKAHRRRKEAYIAGYHDGFKMQEGETKWSDVASDNKKLNASYMAGFLDGVEDRLAGRKSKF